MGGGRKNSSRKYFRLHTLKRDNFYRLKSDNLELVTVVECISAAGAALPPSFVLSKGDYPEPVDNEVFGSISVSDTGWTNQELTFQWFKEVFVPKAKACRINDDPIILFVDGHDSHETDELKDIAYEENIIVVCFPSKCTHKMQPLDIVIYSSTQRRWQDHCGVRAVQGIKIDRSNVVSEYLSTRSFMTPTLIQAAFHATGIHPFNPQIFTDVDFEPS